MKVCTSLVCCMIFLLTGCTHSNQSNPNKNNYKEQSKTPAYKIPNDSATIPEDQQTYVVTIQQMVAEAKKGKALNIPFAAHQNAISDVKKAWGNPDHVDLAGSGYYATYKKKNAVFGYTKAGRIFDVRSNDPSIQSFTLTTIKQVMGNPTSFSVFNNDNIYTYKVNNQFQLKWITPKSTGKVDHISIYSAGDLIEAPTGGTTGTYILQVKGTSQKLSTTAWQSMLQWRQDILAFPKSYPNDVFVNGPNRKMVALTFDDGPDRINTPKIISALKQENVKGTFFFIGQKVQKYPDVVKSAYNNGNVIGSHSFYHHELTKETAEEIHQDLVKTSDAIRKVIGKSPALLRPPFGDTDNKLINIAKRDNYKIIIWSIDTLDWSLREQTSIQKNVFDHVRNGDIILMHSDEDKLETAKAVPVIIKELKRRGFQIVDISTLLNTNAYN